MNFCNKLAFLVVALLFAHVLAQPPRANARGPRAREERRALEPIEPGSTAERNRARGRCDPQFRTLSGVCTNPFFRLWGSTNRAQSSLFFAHSSEFPTGTDLPSARFISNALLEQTIDKPNDRDLNEFVVFFGQFMDHTFVGTPLGEEELPIEIPEDDPIMANFTNGELEFRRSKRARIDLIGLFGSAASALAKNVPGILRSEPRASGPGVSSSLPSSTSPRLSTPVPIAVRQNRRRRRRRRPRPRPGRPNPRDRAGGVGPNAFPPLSQLRFFLRNERPINSLSSALDLSSVYGVDEDRNDALRTSGCELLVDDDDFMPLNNGGFNNAPISTNEYFLAGDVRSNEHPVLTSIHTVWVREHNRICDEIKLEFPSMEDDLMYEIARKINGAQFQKIAFEEFYPAITGRNLPTYSGFRFYRNPAIIDVFSTAAFRVGHTMVGNELSRRGPGNSPLPAIPFTQMFFRTAAQFKAFGAFENFIRGAMQTNAQEIDLEIQDALRNFLFTGIPEEGVGFDLASLNIQRGRDHALPTFNDVRQRLGLRRFSSFADVSNQASVQSALQNVYDGSINKLELWVGLIAEDHEPGSSFGETMLSLWERQFLNLRDGDIFFFRNNIFPSDLREKIPTINRIFNTAELFRQIIVDNTDITAAEIPPKIFFKR